MLPEFSHKVIYPWGRDRLVKRRRRTVIPTDGDMHLRCDHCGSTDWTIHVRPLMKLSAARITVACCSTCGKLFKFDDQGRIGGSLHIDRAAGAKHREEINDRPET